MAMIILLSAAFLTLTYVVRTMLIERDGHPDTWE